MGGGGKTGPQSTYLTGAGQQNAGMQSLSGLLGSMAQPASFVPGSSAVQGPGVPDISVRDIPGPMDSILENKPRKIRKE